MHKLKKSLNVAVVGAGYWGRKVITEYLQLGLINPKIKLVRVCDLKKENLDFCKEALKIGKLKLCTDFNEVISKDVDAIHICTPNDTHYKLCLAALNAGKHVLLEKPMSQTAKEAWELVGVAEHQHLCLQVGHIFRFNKAVRKIQELIATNYFGDLYYLKFQWTTLTPSPANRDIIFDLGPHPVDIINYILNAWPNTVFCTAKAYRRKSLEEVAYILMEFDKNLIAQIELSWLQPGKMRELNIIGKKRSAKVDCLRQEIRIFENSDETSFNLNIDKNNTIFDEVSHFAICIIQNNNNRNPGPIGAGTVAVLESIRKSLKIGKTVNVEMT